MSSEIKRGGKWVRPNFDHGETSGSYNQDAASAQLLESIRNYLEGCQMLQCDVAFAIKEMRELLRKIERNTRKRKRRRKARPI